MSNSLLLKVKNGNKSDRRTSYRVYSSRGNSSQRSSVENEESYRTSSSKRSRSSSISQKKKFMFPQSLLNSINLIKQRRLTPELNQIRESCHRVLEYNTREDRLKLVDVLMQWHPFFSKIDQSIAQAIVLLGKPVIYYKNELIFSSHPSAPKNPYEQSFYKSSQPQLLGRPLQQIGFLLFGKMQLRNDKVFYSHRLSNEGTLFQNGFIAKSNRVEYYAEVVDTCFVLWLSRLSYYVIRKECFLSLDLKYKFGEFENLLKLNTVTKKLPTVQEIKKIVIEPQ